MKTRLIMCLSLILSVFIYNVKLNKSNSQDTKEMHTLTEIYFTKLHLFQNPS